MSERSKVVDVEKVDSYIKRYGKPLRTKQHGPDKVVLYYERKVKRGK